MRSPSLSSFLKPALTAMAAMAIGSAAPKDAQAEEITTITTGKVTDCIGENAAATMSMQGCKTDATVTDGKITSFSPVCSELASDNSMTLPNSTGNQQAISYRGFVVTKYPTNNGIIPGYHFYDEQTGAESQLVINTTNYPKYKNTTNIHFIPGATPDKDLMVFLSDPLGIYPSPFDVNGNPKPECVTGPINPDFSLKTSLKWDSLKANGPKIFALLSGNATINSLTVGNALITEDPNPLTLVGYSTDTWNPINQGFVTLKDKNGIEKTYLTVKASEIATGKDGLYLVNVDDMTDNFATDAGDIAVVDPDKRYMIKSLAGQGKTVIYDNVTGKSAVIAMEEVPQLRGNTTFINTGLKPMWQILSTSGKAYLFQLTDAANMVVDVKEQPFDMFANVYTPQGSAGGQACTELPNPVVTVNTTVTGGDIGPADVDAGSTGDADTTGGDTVVVADVPDAGSGSDGNDGGGSETDASVPQDVGPDQSVTPDAEDATDGDIGFTDMNDTNKDVPLDISLDVALDTEPDLLKTDAGNEVDTQVDGQNDAPDMSKADGSDAVQPKDDVAAGTDAADAGGGNDAAADADSVGTPTPSPKTGCDAGPGKARSSDGALPVAGSLGALAMLLAARRKGKDDSEEEAKN